MRFDIVYEIPTAYGHTALKAAKAYSKEEAEEICKAIERVGYRLVDISRSSEEYGA